MGNAVDLGLHLALAKIRDETTLVIADKYVCSLCRGGLFLEKVCRYD